MNMCFKIDATRWANRNGYCRVNRAIGLVCNPHISDLQVTYVEIRNLRAQFRLRRRHIRPARRLGVVAADGGLAWCLFWNIGTTC